MTGEEAFRCASFGIEVEPEPCVYDRGPVYTLNPKAWAKFVTDDIVPMGDVRFYDGARYLGVLTEDGFVSALDPLLRCLPKHERRQFGVRKVSQWFREMRAADFERDLLPHLARLGVSGVDVLRLATARDGWTLFDTQRVVERETAAHYQADRFEFRLVAEFKLLDPPDEYLRRLFRIDNVKAPDGY